MSCADERPCAIAFRRRCAVRVPTLRRITLWCLLLIMSLTLAAASSAAQIITYG